MGKNSIYNTVKFARSEREILSEVDLFCLGIFIYSKSFFHEKYNLYFPFHVRSQYAGMVAVSLKFKESFCDETFHMLSIVTVKAELK